MKTPAAAATDIHVHPDGTANDPVDGTELDEWQANCSATAKTALYYAINVNRAYALRRT